MENLHKYVNQISWLFAVIDEQLRSVDRTSKPIYSRIDIVMSNEFCTFENCWQKLRRLLATVTRTYRQNLKNGYINTKQLKSSIGPYIDRMHFYSISGYKSLAEICRVLNNSTPPMLVTLLREQRSLMDSTSKLNTIFLQLINTK